MFIISNEAIFSLFTVKLCYNDYGYAEFMPVLNKFNELISSQ